MPDNNYTPKFCVDLLCILAVGIPLGYLYFFGEPYKRGFFCNDLSIRYPDNKVNSISDNLLIVISLCLPTLCMLIVETLLWKYGKTEPTEDDQIPTTVFGFKVNSLICQLYKKISIFLFGALVAQLTTHIGKYTIGALRPHFYAVCQPVFPTGVNCSVDEYITDFICQGTNADRIRDARLSFPSGHASFSAYGMIYVALYLQSRMTCNFSTLFRPLLQAFFIYIAWFTSLSRISDYKHHWIDVLAGMLIGATSAILVVKYVSDLFVTDDGTHEADSAEEFPVLLHNLPTRYDACEFQTSEALEKK